MTATTSSASRLEPFYFGTLEKPLFGCYHAPPLGSARDSGVVLCYPFIQEYMRSHRAFRQLAIQLCNLGFPVLRFDFFGHGDSAGVSEEGEIRQWLNDISSAVGEIRARSRCAKVCLVGLRLGGTLSMIAGYERGDIESMVLWDAVVSGRAYIEELKTLHQTVLGEAPPNPEFDMAGGGGSEILGIRFAESMLKDMDCLHLLRTQQKPANRIFVISSETANQPPLVEHLRDMGSHVEYQHIPGPTIWKEEQGALVPGKLLQAVVGWISEVCP